MSASGNYNTVLTPEIIKYSNFNENNLVLKDTINKFSSFSQYNYSASIGTTIYGTFNFGYGKKIQSIRHTIRPSVSYSIQPSFEK